MYSNAPSVSVNLLPLLEWETRFDCSPSRLTWDVLTSRLCILPIFRTQLILFLPTQYALGLAPVNKVTPFV